MSTVTQVILSLAALVYLFRQLNEWLTSSMTRKMERRSNILNALHTEGAEAISTSFDFWWENGPKETARAKLIDQISNMMFGKSMPDSDDTSEMMEMLTHPLLEGLKVCAQHIALHAHIREQETELLNQFKMSFDESHEQKLEAQRLQLIQYGIDPEELEANFAAA